MSKYINNERGSGVILIIFNFAIVGIMLILVLNIAMVFTKKEQTSIAAEQASLAATSVIYEKVEPVIQHHQKKVIIGVDENGIEIIKWEPLIEKVVDRENQIRSSKLWLSDNEVYIQAVNDVLSAEIPGDDELAGKISVSLNSAKGDIPSVINNIVNENVGEEAIIEIDWKLEQYRIEVITETTFKAVDYNGINFGCESKIPQKGIGPVISFIQVSGW